MKAEDKITEQASHYDHLEQMSVEELLRHINEGDAKSGPTGKDEIISEK